MIEIRDYIKIKDISQIILFHAEYYSEKYGWNHEFEAYVAKPLAEFILRNDSREGIWILDDCGEVKGAIALVRTDDNTAQLRWFYVAPDLQAKGFGKQLMQMLIKFAGTKDYKKIFLWTTSDLLEAITLYRKFEFELVEEQIHFIWGKELTEQKYVRKL